MARGGVAAADGAAARVAAAAGGAARPRRAPFPAATQAAVDAACAVTLKLTRAGVPNDALRVALRGAARAAAWCAAMPAPEQVNAPQGGAMSTKAAARRARRARTKARVKAERLDGLGPPLESGAVGAVELPEDDDVEAGSDGEKDDGDGSGTEQLGVESGFSAEDDGCEGDYGGAANEEEYGCVDVDEVVASIKANPLRVGARVQLVGLTGAVELN
eukprot:gene5735-2398_t